ncbi:alpha-galactosidase [Aquiflexum gelatinilyticum]|uniref:Alpha-galactosidase n=1 Tax=Aquiflexum gelatinilyticum TaxID=2961943 RepID=A0A9X2P524_9BACT|nr:alpha-galactosidase [Aquiflexum gelatinilyticum]MCR9016211.1 alpha-galactosidase [Aquiflexum gelatinilyticum]
MSNSLIKQTARIVSIFIFAGLISCNTNVEQKNFDDWLVDGQQRKAEITLLDGKEIQMDNGLIRRSFILSPNLACFDFTNLMTGEQMLRTVMPEARIILNGKTYQIGGLSGQQERGFFRKEWLDDMKSSHEDFQYQSYEIGEITPHFPTKTVFWTGHKKDASGKKVSFSYIHPDFENLILKVHYEIFDDLPLMGKYLTLENTGKESIHINQVVNEILGIVEEESAVVGSTEKMKKPHQLYIENNFAFNNAMHAELSSQTTHWKPDSSYTSQVNYELRTPSILEVYPERGIGIDLKPRENFQSIRTYELVLDSYDRERNGLARRKMYRALAPWTLQNPIFMHLVSKNDEEVRTAIDQCVATGYEALILSFGSHINMEDISPENISRWKDLADYAHDKGIKIGGYSLFSSRKISDEHDVISPLTGKPGGAFFGNAPCMASQWGLDYLDKLRFFFENTGFDIFENDGPYPGDVCASTTHPGHEGLHDSQWVQINLQKSLYQWMNARGIYINAPDWYFLDGTHKIALGYREVNFSLPRERQKILNRQNIHDGTWEKTPSMGWGFVPLTAYHGGGADAVLEPLSEHLEDYRQLMMQYYGAGVQACYRGPRLYDTEETKAVVISVIDWYKKYRDILNADIIRLRRADGRDWDGWMHVDPQGREKALVMLFNPTKEPMSKDLVIPLYYTGLNDKASISVEGKNKNSYALNQKQEVTLRVDIPADGYTWFVVE